MVQWSQALNQYLTIVSQPSMRRTTSNRGGSTRITLHSALSINVGAGPGGD